MSPPVMSPPVTSRRLDVLATGPLSTLQDQGRTGRLALGVSPSGAADQTAYALANRILGNATGVPAIETTRGGLRVRARGDLLVSVTGAPTPVDVDGRGLAMDALIPLRDSQILTIGLPLAGLRSYLAVRGGIVAERMLGSCSTDTLSGLGPPPLTEGDVLAIGAEPGELPQVDHAPGRMIAASTDAVTLRVSPGPRADWFEDGDGRTPLSALTSSPWMVSARSDRKGIRLTSPTAESPTAESAGSSARIRRRREHEGRELASEAMVPGAIQVPTGGEPVILHRDHPVTGGYPVIAVVDFADLDRAAQLVPGQEVRFRL